jgi:DNA repair protein RecO (recombination protein O)
MLLKTAGIVIKYIKYGESSIICKIYTRELGLLSFIINGIRSKSSKNKIALLQPLTLLDLVIYNKENSSIKRISEMKIAYPFKTSSLLLKKSVVLLFLSEVLDRLLNEATPNIEVFDFVTDALKGFDNALENYDNFHLQFLIFLTSLLGIQPLDSKEMIENSIMQKVHYEILELRILDELIANPFSSNININHSLRKKFLDSILNFYKSHIDNFGEMKSLKVLTEVFSS